MVKKNYLKIALATLLVTAFVSCSSNDDKVSETANNSSQFIEKSGKLSTRDSIYAVNTSKQAMVSFVRGIKTHYKPGMSYSALKNALNPGVGLPAIKREGDNLLSQAYRYLATNTSESNMKGDQVLLALHAIVKNNKNISFTTDRNLVLGSQYLFGLNNNSPAVQTQSTNGCKWYQLGCLWDEIWCWLSSPASGGGATNGEILAAVVTIVAAILGVAL